MAAIDGSETEAETKGEQDERKTVVLFKETNNGIRHRLYNANLIEVEGLFRQLPGLVYGIFH